MDQVMQEQPKSRRVSALFIPAGLFVGMGIGYLTGHFLPGLFIGMGAGFVISAVFMLLRKQE